MVKFIELTNSFGTTVSVNTNYITHFWADGHNCVVQLTPAASDGGMYDNYITAVESYEEVKALING